MIKKIEISIILLLSFFAFYCAIEIGSSWDEAYEMNIGKDRLKYLLSFGDTKYLDSHSYTKFYPALYNTLAIFVTKFFPSKYEIEIWHLLNTLFSIGVVFGIYKITKSLFDKKLAKIVFIICFLNPTFFGHMFINSKDTIVAFAHVWFTYTFIKYLKKQNLNFNCNRYILVAGLMLGLGTGVRLPFITTLIPVFIFFVVDLFYLKSVINSKFSLKNFTIDSIKVLVIAYIILVFFWPQTHTNIITEPFNLFLSHVKVGGGGLPWILFNYNYHDTLQLPYSYILISLIYKSPEFILICYLIFVFIILLNKQFFLNKYNFFWKKLFLILFIILFPVIVFVFLPYRIYDGLRLFLYIVPYYCIIPGLVFYYLFYNLNSIFNKIGLTILIASFFYYLFIFVQFTPYQYTYLNILNGSLSNAHKKFENDYWGVSIKELIKKISTNIESNKKIKLAFCGINHELTMKELDKFKNIEYEVVDIFNNNFEYVIMTNRIVGDKKNDILSNVKSCYEKFEGKDFIKIERNKLVLSTIRKK